jgi:hypothetical protein
MEEMEEKLKEVNIKYMKRAVEDEQNGTRIDQLFFNDPDGFMIEICNCENLKLVPAAASLGKIKLSFDTQSAIRLYKFWKMGIDRSMNQINSL